MMVSRVLESIIRTIGFGTYIKLESLARCITGKPRTSANARVGLGIGVGTYSTGSPRLRERLPTLADFKALWVRDAESVENLKRFAGVMRGEIIQGSDLAFLTEEWLGKVAPRPAHAGKPRLGIALRDWPASLGGWSEEALKAEFATLAATYDITGFILDAHADPLLTRALEPYNSVIWQPEKMRIADYAAALATQDVLLTCRAHAAICGACVGVPSAIVAIEPKLAQVAAMLSNTSVLAPVTALPAWAAAIQQARSTTPDRIAADVSRNREASLAAFDAVRRHLP